MKDSKKIILKDIYYYTFTLILTIKKLNERLYIYVNYKFLIILII